MEHDIRPSQSGDQPSNHSARETEQSVAADPSQRAVAGELSGRRQCDTNGGAAPRPAPQIRELAAIALLVVVCDLVIYRGGGFTGYGLLFACGPALLMLGATRPRHALGAWMTGVMLALLAVRLTWCGSEFQVAAGFFLLVAFSMALAGLVPHVLETIVYASQTVLAGYSGAIHHWRWLSKTGPTAPRVAWLNLMLPAFVCLLFSLLFVLANPNLLNFFGEQVEWVFVSLRDLLIDNAPPPLEIALWAAVAWIALGLLRPVMGSAAAGQSDEIDTQPESQARADQTPAPLYAPFRNTLLMVIVLFAGYLTYEYFQALWFRTFPDGFHYSGYAHEGAAWLTVALALSTLLLSMIFRGRVLDDARLRSLRLLAWVWSLENLLLAMAVYHRLLIYIGFNGMSRMRIVGIYGMTAVVIGFVFVLWKISRNRDFVWLIRRHLWTVVAMAYLFAITPVDMIVVGYNVRRIMAGDPAPAVQISVHPISHEGLLMLRPLLECDDPTIQQGVKALLASRHDELEEAVVSRDANWTDYQCADDLLLKQLRADSHLWSTYADVQARNEALRRFHDYAYQWY